MRRVIESTRLSLDGVIGSSHLWASQRFDDEARAAALARIHASDAMLMGRKSYEISSRLGPNQTGSYADSINAIPKYVLSSTLTDAAWTNSTIVRGNVATEVERMKQQGERTGSSTGTDSSESPCSSTDCSTSCNSRSTPCSSEKARHSAEGAPQRASNWPARTPSGPAWSSSHPDPPVREP